MASELSNVNRGPGLIAEYCVFLLLSLFLVLCRAYTRLRVTEFWGWDDTTIIIAWIFSLISFVFFCLMIEAGLGRHKAFLSNPEQDVLDLIKWQVGFQTAIVICTLVTKLSISLMILRIKDTKSIRYALGIMMFLMTSATVAMIITEFISCIPLAALWTPSIKGKCIPPSKVYLLAYIQSGATIVADLCLTASPVIILWNVRINKKKKTLILGLMSLGLIASVCNAIRSGVQGGLLTDDTPYATVPIVIVCILEQGFGIIAACIPTCMPLLMLSKRRKEQSRYMFENQTGRRQARLRSESSKDGAWRVYDGNDAVPLAPLHKITTDICSE
ncbi:integral membrane protein [Rutstroemia sp. NJR-2017a BBW]|nr:integral membrane protein [Rutstroemia sp. NJR-2017a BBW]